MAACCADVSIFLFKQNNTVIISSPVIVAGPISKQHVAVCLFVVKDVKITLEWLTDYVLVNTDSVAFQEISVTLNTGCGEMPYGCHGRHFQGSHSSIH